MRRLLALAALPVLGALLAACASSPLGRSQLLLFPPDQVAQMGELAYREISANTPEAESAQQRNYVQCVATNVLRATGAGSANWEVRLFKDDSANAFALPGGKIGVNTGLLEVAKTPDQLAAVIGHEIAHVEAQHGNERLSTSFATDTGLQLLAALGGGASQSKQQVLGLLGLGAQVGVLLPYGRAQESEADLLGLDYMARAGFDPQGAVELWRNMIAAGGRRPPEFLSTHPSGENRIAALEGRMPQAKQLYQQARAAGRRPGCSP